MGKIVELNGLTKAYGDVKAVNNVSFTMNEQKIYGLLGRNGAGKTTIMQMITAQLFSTSGELKVFGENPYENNHVLSQICFIKESQKYPDVYRIIDVLNISASFFPNWDHDYALSLAEEFRLPLKRRMKKLSRGMLSSVGIIVGLASRAPLTIFDEPYLGLDAVARSLFYERLIEDNQLFYRRTCRNGRNRLHLHLYVRNRDYNAGPNVSVRDRHECKPHGLLSGNFGHDRSRKHRVRRSAVYSRTRRRMDGRLGKRSAFLYCAVFE
jgi:ABC-type Na+ transport system ATPase subunit NatA